MPPVRLVLYFLSLRMQEGNRELFFGRSRLLQGLRGLCSNLSGQSNHVDKRGNLMATMDLRGQTRVLDGNRAGAYGVLLSKPDVIAS